MTWKGHWGFCPRISNSSYASLISLEVGHCSIFSQNLISWVCLCFLMEESLKSPLLLLFDRDNWVMEWIITGFVRQCPVTVSAIGLLTFFVQHYPRQRNILDRLPQIVLPPHYIIGALGRILKKVFYKTQVWRAISWLAIEIITKWKWFKKGRNTSALFSLNSDQKRETSLLSKNKPKEKNCYIEKGFLFVEMA